MRAALITTTKSPTSQCGVYSGLVLPRSLSAIWVASRPSVLPLASTTTQLRSRFAGVATKVFIYRRERVAGQRQFAGPPPVIRPSGISILPPVCSTCRVPCRCARERGNQLRRPLPGPPRGRIDPSGVVALFCASPSAHPVGVENDGLTSSGNNCFWLGIRLCVCPCRHGRRLVGWHDLHASAQGRKRRVREELRAEAADPGWLDRQDERPEPRRRHEGRVPGQRREGRRKGRDDPREERDVPHGFSTDRRSDRPGAGA